MNFHFLLLDALTKTSIMIFKFLCVTFRLLAGILCGLFLELIDRELIRIG